MSAIILSLLCVNTVVAQITYESRALTGTDGPLGPGQAPNVHFAAFFATTINRSGQTAFWGNLTGAGVDFTNNIGVWSEGGGSGLTLVARTGFQISGMAPGVTFYDLSAPVLSNSGQTAFQGTLEGPGVTSTNNRGIWVRGGGSSPTLVARSGNNAPGTAAGVNFNIFTNPVIDDAGQTAFRALLNGSGVTNSNNQGIWSAGGGSGLALVARTGGNAPGTTPGVNFSGFSNPLLNGSGQTAFHGFLTGAGVTGSNNSGIWSQGNGSGLTLVARAGNQSPGTETGVNFEVFNSLVLNNAGQTAFRGNIVGAGVNSSNNEGIWSEGGGSGLNLVAREGNHAPGTTAGVNFSVFSRPAFNDAGQTAFRGSLVGESVTNSNNEGIWSEGGGMELALVARAGDYAPGTNDGVNFRFFDFPVLNGTGQTAFWGQLIGSGVNSSNDSGIWATGLDGQLRLIVRTGDYFDVNNDPLIDDLRTISFLSLADSFAGRSSFNDDGLLTFVAEFTDGSQGVFVAHTAVPEPGSLLLLLMVGVPLCLRRHRK